jgi:hypothetical protein
VVPPSSEFIHTVYLKQNYFDLKESLMSLHRIANVFLTRQVMCIQRNTEARSRNQCCRGEAETTTYSECVPVTSVIQHAMRIRPIILSSVACQVVPYFRTFSHKLHDFREKKFTEDEICGMIFSTTFI